MPDRGGQRAPGLVIGESSYFCERPRGEGDSRFAVFARAGCSEVALEPVGAAAGGAWAAGVGGTFASAESRRIAAVTGSRRP